MTGLVDGLLVRSERMRENIARGLGLHASSHVLLALVDVGRDVARGGVRHRPARVAARRGRARAVARPPGGRSGRRPAAVAGRLDACFDDAAYLRHVPEVIARLDRIAAGLTERAAGGPAHALGCPMLADAYLRSGKVRDLYARADGSPRARRVGPDVRVRRRAADRDPRQGPRADRAVAALVRDDRRTSFRTTSSRPRRTTPRCVAGS